MSKRLELLQGYVDQVWQDAAENPSAKTQAVLLGAADVVLAAIAEDERADPLRRHRKKVKKFLRKWEKLMKRQRKLVVKAFGETR